MFSLSQSPSPVRPDSCFVLLVFSHGHNAQCLRAVKLKTHSERPNAEIKLAMESRTSVKFCGQNSFIRCLQISISLIILCTVSVPTRSPLIQSQPLVVHSLPAIVSIIKVYVCVCVCVCDAVPVQSCLPTLSTNVTSAASRLWRTSQTDTGLVLICS